jgi:hypothetical protein
MIVTELRQPLEVDTPLGKGDAILVETGPADQFWTVALKDSCALVTFPQNRIRISRSYTHGRIKDDEMVKIIARKSKPSANSTLLSS